MQLAYVFDRFHRVKGAQGRSYEGSGIGLSLVQELVKLHEGTIEVSSTVNQGTCFTVSIPTGYAHLPSERIGARRNLISTSTRATSYIEEALRWLPENIQQQIEGEAVSPELPVSAARSIPTARIVLADDNADMRDYLKRLLSPYYEVEAVSDGRAALAAIRQQVPDLLLTDVMMPEMDGFELLRLLRHPPAGSPLQAELKARDLPIILLSARAGEEARIEGLEAGADDYLTKPFSARELLARVEATLKLSQLRQEALQREQALRSTSEAAKQQAEFAYRRIDQLLERMSDAFVALDRDWRITYQNAASEWINSNKPRSEVIGKTLWEEWPAAIGSIAEQQYRRAIAEQIPVHFEQHYHEPPDHDVWLEVHAYPFEEGLGIFYRDISDRKAIEQQREQLLAQEYAAREAAEAANRIKDEFLAVLSHELRTPLNPILGWSRLLKNGNLDATKTAQAIDIIERNAKLQTQLIEDLLDVSRILRGKLSLNTVPVDIEAITKSALDTVRLSAEAKSIQLQTHLHPIHDRVLGDAARLQQVVWNLLSNAIKFTPEGGRVEIRLEQIETHVQIPVSDTGKGITPEFLPYVFEYFRQADSTTTRKFGGLGLGLAIVRQLVELHGGTVQASSPGEDQGSTFMVRLPCLKTSSDLSHDSPASPDSQAMSLANVLVLVVDDEEDSRELIAFILRQSGAIVTMLSSAIEALAAIGQTEFDVLISDIGMPQMNGYMLMQQIQQRNKVQPIAIALTAYAGETNQQEAIAAGFQCHLAKPVEPEALVKTIQSLLTKVH
ncbi:MAG: hybrid sensor histidine kinase/response regulator [Leptolyngbya sp. ERB_1_1]